MEFLRQSFLEVKTDLKEILRPNVLQLANHIKSSGQNLGVVIESNNEEGEIEETKNGMTSDQSR